MWFSLVEKSRPRLKEAALLVALSTSMPQYRALYSQAREVGTFLLDKLKFEEVATIHSSSFGPDVIVRDEGISNLPACRIHLHRGKRSILLVTGDGSPMDDQYEFAAKLLDHASGVGATEVFSVGARWAETPLTPYQDPVVNGFASDAVGVKKLRKLGVKVIESEPAPFFASMVVGLAPRYGMKGYKISVDHGEPAPHTRTVISMVEVLAKALDFEADLGELRSQVKAPPPEQKVGDSSIYH